MAIVVVLAGTWLGYQRLADKGCTGQIKLSVAAATEIAPAVDQAAQRWIADGANIGGTCVSVSVSPVNPATMAAAIARDHKATLTGLGAAPASVVVPDVWLPDSSTWLLRLKSEAVAFVPTDGTSVAESPIVVGMPKPIAEGIGWPNRKLGWKDLLTQMTTSNKIRPGIVDPTRDASGLAGLLALSSVAGATPDGQKAAVGALRALAAGSSALRDDLLQRFPHSADDPNDIASSLGAAPMSEEDVVSYNAEKPAVPLAALYLEPAPPALDYPFAVMPEVGLQKQTVATGLRGQMQKSTFKNALAAAGLRSADGTVGSGFAAPVGAPGASSPVNASGGSPDGGGTAASGLDASEISQAIGRWAAITVPGRVLAVFDISGSMLTKVPTAGNATRAQVTQSAAAQGLGLFDDKWAVGVWLFSTELVGKQPWKEIVPISPLSSARQLLQGSIKQIVPKPDGATGLYDTALAAYKSVQDSWQGGRINSVILFTDGKNENKDGITRTQLVSQLTKLKDPRRPVRMVIIGIGDEVDRNELEAITNATSAGGVFIAEDPAKISQIFLEAIATRSGAAG
jgi:Ca-activated chloride channel family protein